MNTKLKTGLVGAGLVILIGGSALLYNQLKENYSLGNSLLAETTKNIEQETDSVTETKEQIKKDEKEEETQAETETEIIQAPDFTVQDMDGNDVKLSDMFGKPIVLNFWASWCEPCKNEMPEFEEVYKERKDDVIFMMVNMTDGKRETLTSAKNHIEEKEFTFPVYFDMTQEVMYTYSVWSLPTTYFIDADGNLVTGARGQIDKKTLEYGISLIMPEE